MAPESLEFGLASVPPDEDGLADDDSVSMADGSVEAAVRASGPRLPGERIAARASAARGELTEIREKVGQELAHLSKAFEGSEKEMKDLLAILQDALSFWPPLYPNSILGHPWTWIPPHPEYSEFRIFDTRDMMRAIKYFVDVTVPALPFEMPENLPGFGTAVFWRPTRILFQPDPNDDPYSHPDEAWVYINGIGTNPEMARLNASYLAKIFGRPMTIIQNATDSIMVDLFEAVLGKALPVVTEAAAKAYPFIHHALHHEDKKRVVVLCHSQGTIVMSNVLRALVDESHRESLEEGLRRMRQEHDCSLRAIEDTELLKKLEIYAFANCADVMMHAPVGLTEAGNRVPWIESYGNQYDFVARCGALAPNREKHGIRIDGAIYVNDGAWGHCLNHHYLRRMMTHLEHPHGVTNPYRLSNSHDGPFLGLPRLYSYYDNASPDPY